jgi:hypothetical protein
LPGLPSEGLRWIPDANVRDYLLNATSAKGRSRLAFLTGFGFSRSGWMVLKAALMDHAMTAAVQQVRLDQWGTTYCATGPMTSPDGRNPRVRAYWIIRRDDGRPQFTSPVPSP